MDEIFKQYGGSIITVIAVVGLIGCISYADEGIALSLNNKLGKELSKKIVTDVRDNNGIISRPDGTMTNKEKQSVMVNYDKLLRVIREVNYNTSEGYLRNNLIGVDRVMRFKNKPDSSWTDVGKVKGNVYAKIENNRLKMMSSNGKAAFDNIKNMFDQSINLTDVSGLADWDVSNVKSMRSVFWRCKKLTNISSLKNWKVSNVKDAQWMFRECEKLTDINPLKDWDVSNVTNMVGMFQDCNNFIEISPLKNWDVSRVRNMDSMFSYCKNITNISPLKDWNVSNVTDMRWMFYSCEKLTDINPLKDWDVSNVEHAYSMFFDTNLNQTSREMIREKFGKNKSDVLGLE